MRRIKRQRREGQRGLADGAVPYPPIDATEKEDTNIHPSLPQDELEQASPFARVRADALSALLEGSPLMKDSHHPQRTHESCPQGARDAAYRRDLSEVEKGREAKEQVTKDAYTTF